MTKTGRQSTRHHEMHTQDHALKKETPIYDFFPVSESRLYWYCQVDSNPVLQKDSHNERHTRAGLIIVRTQLSRFGIVNLFKYRILRV